MSRTLFWYIFRDLLKIFLMTSGVLAGIMSFGGLLRPLTEHGLDVGQVGRILAYLMPAMQTFSLPVAALFATTIVYGRLSADNELTACRATGISYLSLTLPALVLGMLMAIVSLLCLSFIVPHYTLKVERVLVSNLAEAVQKHIEKTHQLKLKHPKLGEVTMFAQAVQILDPDPSRPHDQRVRLVQPMFIKYEERGSLRVANEFIVAQAATAYIGQGRDTVRVTAIVEDGVRFPREIKGYRASVGMLSYGPIEMDSPIREDTKFMNIQQLKELRARPETSRQVRKVVRGVVEREQEKRFLESVRDALNSPARECRLERPGESMVLRRGDLPATLDENGLVIGSSDSPFRQVRLERWLAGQRVSIDDARRIVLEARADNEDGRMLLDARLDDVQITNADGTASRDSPLRQFSVAMPPDLAALANHTAREYLTSPHLSENQRRDLAWVLGRLNARVLTELHGRASFGLSCLILVMVGCALGMMFKSGNFLSAFAVSVVPALLTIPLIVTGQHVGESNPGATTLAVAIIWSGNVAVLTLASVLLARLQRQ